MIASLRVLIALFVAAAATIPSARAEVTGPAGTYTYTIKHPDHGDIGTYVNKISRNSDSVSVSTDINVLVKVAFVPVYRLEADRREVWRNGRLVSYSSVTRKNGNEIRVSGKAEGDKFVIDTPSGRIDAPADVFPMNPWSQAITKADAVIASESGKVYDARLAGSDQKTITVNGQQIATRHYQVAADTRHELWFDQQGRLIQFATNDEGKTISFVLNQ